MERIKYIDGGVCSPKGFEASGIACGIKGGGREDLALIVSRRLCSAAAVYTTNKVKGAPLAVTRDHLTDGRARAIVCNSGNANTCAPNGREIAEETCRIAAGELRVAMKAPEIAAEDMIVCSTGVIGQALHIEPFQRGIPEAVQRLAVDGSDRAARAIMTTDTVTKSAAVEVRLGGKLCTIGGIAKGSGMIDPNMATMLAFITTDAAIAPETLQRVLSEDVRDSFNQICVDGDTSTNDMAVVLANGMAGNQPIEEDGPELETFKKALSAVTVRLAKKLARDGEGATKLIQCTVSGAPDQRLARRISKAVISSNLLKAAMFGEDANWGRVLCAVGYAEGDFSADNIDVAMESDRGRIQVCRASSHWEYSEAEAEKILQAEEICIQVDLHQGNAAASAWGCDLTCEYVKINGDYRS